jgi:6,7-dimethyl-8-ribityllumazine synthase
MTKLVLDSAKLKTSSKKICIIGSEFNSQIVQKIINSCSKKLYEFGIKKKDLKTFIVPGALEIPWLLNQLIKKKNFSGYICVGCIIKGDTYHFEVVSNCSAFQISSISANNSFPVINTVLTCYSLAQAKKRALTQGEFSATALIKLLNLKF